MNRTAYPEDSKQKQSIFFQQNTIVKLRTFRPDQLFKLGRLQSENRVNKILSEYKHWRGGGGLKHETQLLQGQKLQFHYCRILMTPPDWSTGNSSKMDQHTHRQTYGTRSWQQYSTQQLLSCVLALGAARCLVMVVLIFTGP